MQVVGSVVVLLVVQGLPNDPEMQALVSLERERRLRAVFALLEIQAGTTDHRVRACSVQAVPPDEGVGTRSVSWGHGPQEHERRRLNAPVVGVGRAELVLFVLAPRPAQALPNEHGVPFVQAPVHDLLERVLDRKRLETDMPYFYLLIRDLLERDQLREQGVEPLVLAGAPSLRVPSYLAEAAHRKVLWALCHELANRAA